MSNSAAQADQNTNKNDRWLNVFTTDATHFRVWKTTWRNHLSIPYHPDDGGSMILRNVGILPHHHTVPQPRW